MQSDAKTVEAYLTSLPADRREAIEAVRKVILDNLDSGYEEGMTYGMVGYYVPHRNYPAGYHCNPKQPLPFANLASQKNHMALYLMYTGWLREHWPADKKLDMGKGCLRFKKLADLPLELIGEAIRRMPAAAYIKWVEEVRQSTRKSAPSAAE